MISEISKILGHVARGDTLIVRQEIKPISKLKVYLASVLIDQGSYNVRGIGETPEEALQDLETKLTTRF